jgi:hypothetical protein
LLNEYSPREQSQMLYSRSKVISKIDKKYEKFIGVTDNGIIGLLDDQNVTDLYFLIKDT